MDESGDACAGHGGTWGVLGSTQYLGRREWSDSRVEPVCPQVPLDEGVN